MDTETQKRIQAEHNMKQINIMSNKLYYFIYGK